MGFDERRHAQLQHELVQLLLVEEFTQRHFEFGAHWASVGRHLDSHLIHLRFLSSAGRDDCGPRHCVPQY